MEQHPPLAPRPQWLRRTFETALEPELPLCDSHHHLQDDGPGGAYRLEQVLADTCGGHDVLSSIAVAGPSRTPAAIDALAEPALAQAVAEKSASGPKRGRIAAAIVGRADFGLGAGVATMLEAQCGATARFRGVTHAPASDSDGPLYDSAFREAFALLGKYRLCFDARLAFHQLPALADLARAFPDVPIALDNTGGVLGVGPYANRDEVFAVWKRHIDELAKCPNVCVKLGGLGAPRCGFGWHERPAPPTSIDLAQAYRPYILHAIERFGPQRAMFGSHFPEDKLASSYTTLWNCFKWLTREFTLGERADLLHDTAFRFYRLYEG